MWMELTLADFTTGTDKTEYDKEILSIMILAKNFFLQISEHMVVA